MISINKKLLLAANMISFYDLKTVIDVNIFIGSKPRVTLSSYSELDYICNKLKCYIKVENIADSTTRFTVTNDVIEFVYVEVNGVEF